MRAIAFVESNTTGTGELFVRAALRRGLHTYFLTSDRSRYGFLEDLPVVTIAIDTSSVDRLVEFLSAVPEVAAVFSSSEYYIATASEVAAKLGLHTSNAEAIKICRDKARLVEKLSGAGIAVPRSVDIPLLDLSKADLGCLNYPVVVKPRTGSGSVDVKLNTNPGEVLAHCERMRQEGQVWALMQEYVEGREYSVETLTVGGITRVLAVVRKHLSPQPYFVETGHSFPSGLSADERARVEAVTVDALEAVGFAFGPAHTELRLLGNTTTIIEINPRLAGGMIPALLQEVLDFDVIDYVLDMWIGPPSLPEVSPKRFGAIRFALSPRAGVLSRSAELPMSVAALPELRRVHVMRHPGDRIGPARDFRDRVAVVVCAGDHQDDVEAAAERAAAAFRIEVDDTTVDAPAMSRKPLPRSLQHIVYRDTADRADPHHAEWLHLLDINEAHLIMLCETGLVAHDSVRQLIAAHRALRSDSHAALGNSPMSRGLYMQLEQHMIDALGEEIGGSLQTGRSRNDINATTTKLILRDSAERVFAALWGLRRNLVHKASQEIGKAFPIYSQYQPALPGTVTHQLLAFDAALATESTALLGLFDEIGVCPLGAGAGGGTTLPIDSELVCRLLGFSRPASNSIDAVANRSAVVRFLSAMNSVGLVMSRVAQDLQLWSTVEFGLVSFPDELTGGSSMLPQKRNPFLVEFIKGRASVPLSALVGCSALVGKAPFTNSYEVGSHINRFVVEAEQAVVDMLHVAKALFDGMEVSIDRTERHLRNTAVASLGVSESIAMRDGISFRTAHTQVACALQAQRAVDEPPHQALLEMDREYVSRGPFGWASSHTSGSGPGSATLGCGVALACHHLAIDAAEFAQLQETWQQARDLRAHASEQLVRE